MSNEARVSDAGVSEAGSPGAPHPSPHPPRFDHGKWKQQTLDRVLLFAFVFLVVAAALSFRDELEVGELVVAPFLALSAVLIGISAFARVLPVVYRSVCFVSGLALGFIATMVGSGFLVPNPIAAAIMGLVFLALMLGPRAAWIGWAAFVIALGVVAYLHASGRAEVQMDEVLDPTDPTNWIRVIVIFALIAAFTTLAVTSVIRRLEVSLEERDSLLEELGAETEEKLSALERRSQLEDRLREAQKMEALGTLAGGVAHDFNNLLTIVATNASVAEIELGEDEETVREALGQIQRAGKRGALLTEKLLAFGRQQQAERGPVDVNAKLIASVDLLERLLPQGVTVSVQPGEGLGKIYISEVELDQIVLNLSLNARDAMPGGGSITVSSSADRREGRDGVLIRVKDTGEGMPSEVRRRIFEPFYTRRRAGGGTGLGLSVVHSIVEECEGFISVASEEGVGTEFAIWFPVTDEPDEETVEVVGGSETVLLVDDEPLVRHVHGAMALTRAGYPVIVAESGQEALALVEAHPEIKLVVTDVVMPGLNGRELHDAIRERSPGMPFLFCTGYASQILEDDFLEGEGRGLLRKPCPRKKLLATVREMLDRSSAGSG